MFGIENEAWDIFFYFKFYFSADTVGGFGMIFIAFFCFFFNFLVGNVIKSKTVIQIY